MNLVWKWILWFTTCNKKMQPSVFSSSFKKKNNLCYKKKNLWKLFCCVSNSKSLDFFIRNLQIMVFIMLQFAQLMRLFGWTPLFACTSFIMQIAWKRKSYALRKFSEQKLIAFLNYKFFTWCLNLFWHRNIIN